VNSIGKATNEKLGMAALTLIMLTLFVFTAGTTVQLQAQTDPADAKVPAVKHNSWSKETAMPTAPKGTAPRMQVQLLSGGERAC
jgi:hypothetical protein